MKPRALLTALAVAAIGACSQPTTGTVGAVADVIAPPVDTSDTAPDGTGPDDAIVAPDGPLPDVTVPDVAPDGPEPDTIVVPPLEVCEGVTGPYWTVFDGVDENVSRFVAGGDVGFVSTWKDGAGSLVALDLSEAGEPVVLATLSLGDTAWDLDLVGDVAVVANGNTGMTLVDVSQPAQPAIVGNLPLGGFVHRLVTLGVPGHVAVLVKRVEPTLVVVDVTQPDQPVEVWQQPRPQIGHLASDGDRLYDMIGQTITAFDVSDPTATAPTGSYEPGEKLGFGLVASGGLLYFTTVEGATNVVRIVDASDMSAPKLLGTAELPTASPGAPWLQGDTLYVNSQSAFPPSLGSSKGAGLFRVDVSDPTAPVVIGEPLKACAGRLSGTADKILLSCSQLGARALRSPITAEVTRLPLEEPTFDVAVAGGMAYLAQDDAGVAVVDVSDPAAPALVGQLEPTKPFDFTRSVIVHGDYLVEGGQGVTVRALAPDPANAPVVAVITDAWTNDVAMAGDVLLSAGGGNPQNQFRIVDLTDPTAPGPVTSLEVDYAASYAVAGDRDRAFLGTTAGTVAVVSVADPQAPVTLAEIIDGERGKVLALAVDGQRLFVRRELELTIYDISDVTAPQPTSSRVMPDLDLAVRSHSVTVAGGLLLVASGKATPSLVGLSLPDAPSDPEAVLHYDLSFPIAVALTEDHAFAAGAEALEIVKLCTP